MGHNQYGDFVPDNSDVAMSGDTPGMTMDEIDQTTMMGNTDCLDGGRPTSDFESDPASVTLMPNRMGPSTKQ
jgi:hypothetical protein